MPEGSQNPVRLELQQVPSQEDTHTLYKRMWHRPALSDWLASSQTRWKPTSHTPGFVIPSPIRGHSLLSWRCTSVLGQCGIYFATCLQMPLGSSDKGKTM